MSELYLIHHGIKDQKWGVRRFQNEDGSLTEEGKRRYYAGKHTPYMTSYAIKQDMDDVVRKANANRSSAISNAKNNYKIEKSGAINKQEKVIAKTKYKDAKKQANDEWKRKTDEEVDRAHKAFAESTKRGENIAKSVLFTAGGLSMYSVGSFLLSQDDTTANIVGMTMELIGSMSLGAGVTIGYNEHGAKARGYRN